MKTDPGSLGNYQIGTTKKSCSMVSKGKLMNVHFKIQHNCCQKKNAECIFLSMEIKIEETLAPLGSVYFQETRRRDAGEGDWGSHFWEKSKHGENVDSAFMAKTAQRMHS